MKAIRLRTHRSGAQSWYYRYMYQGRRRERPAKSEEHAVQQLAWVKLTIANGMDPHPELEATETRATTPAVKTVIDLYMDKLRPAERKGERTFQQLQEDRAFCNSKLYAKNLKEHFKGAVTQVTVVSLRAYAKTRTCGNGTKNHELDFLRAAFNYYLRLYPKSRIPSISWADARLKYTEKPRERRTSDDEITAIERRIDPIYTQLPRVAVETIMRASELCMLEWEDVDGRDILLPAHKTKGKKKARRIPITSRCRAALDAIPGPRRGLVFKSPAGAHVYHGLSAALKDTGVGVTCHNLRHEAASRFMENGGDVKALMEVGGWSSLAMVMRYSHSTTERAREIMERGARGAQEIEAVEAQ